MPGDGRSGCGRAMRPGGGFSRSGHPVSAPGQGAEREEHQQARALAGAQGYLWVERDIKLRRDPQELRSKVSAHHKGSNYEKSLDKLIGQERGQRAAGRLLRRSLLMLESLNRWRASRSPGAEEQ